ncbi:flagellar hook-length control protein FliK, partial [Geobacillus stearothermophilus]
MVERMERTVPVAAVRDAASSGQFRPGQAVVGRIERVEEAETGERTALVRTGGRLVRARLEAPLAAGRTYLFEIKESGSNVYWKAVALSEPEQAVPREDVVRRWQQAWKLPEAALPVLRQALKAGAAVTKE